MMFSNDHKLVTKQKTACTGCFRSLGVDVRMDIYNYLSKNNVSSVSQIVEEVGLTQPTVSYHLKKMKKDGLLASTKSGKEVLYKVNHVCPHSSVQCILEDVSFPNKESINIC